MTLNSMLESQVELLQSAGLARKTVEQLGLARDRKFVQARPSPLQWLQGQLVKLRKTPPPGGTGAVDPLDMPAQQLLGMLRVRRVGQTYVLAISITSPSPTEAAWLAKRRGRELSDRRIAGEGGRHPASDRLAPGAPQGVCTIRRSRPTARCRTTKLGTISSTPTAG